MPNTAKKQPAKNRTYAPDAVEQRAGAVIQHVESPGGSKSPGKRSFIPPQATPRSMLGSRSRRILDACGIEVIALTATYVANPGSRRALILDGRGTCSVEEYACRYFQGLGYRTAILENKPIHVLFGTYMWSVIQDPGDRRCGVVGFGDAQAYDAGIRRLICSRLPRDFGKPEYAIRRARQITAHLAGIAGERQQLRRLFEEGLGPSLPLRNYLWAHRAEHIEVARQLIDLLAPGALIGVLYYLVEHYWEHYAGWPDLLVYRDEEFHIVEVKSAGDQLGDNQQRWISDNHARLHLPFKLVEVGRG